MSILLTWLAHARSRVIGAVLDQDCALCGAASGAAQLCPPCHAELPVLAPGCPVCAMPCRRGETCGSCLARPPWFDGTTAVWRYAYPVDRLVQALKFHGRLALAPYFAHALAGRVGHADLVIPMPLHASRLVERGFNQAVEIASSLARETGSRFLPRGAVRIRPTQPQANLPFEERSKNVRGAFECVLDLPGTSIAVVDDVMTTGATLNELARVLKRSGAARVENWVVARTLD